MQNFKRFIAFMDTICVFFFLTQEVRSEHKGMSVIGKVRDRQIVPLNADLKSSSRFSKAVL